MTGRIIGHGVGKRYILDGVEVDKETFDASFPDRPMAQDGECALSATPPHLSDALAVHPNQVQEAMESAKRRGVPTDFISDGRPLFTSRAHQAAYLKAYRDIYPRVNRDGGYGD